MENNGIMINPHTSDPPTLQNIVKKEAEVKVASNRICRGWVQSIDPISKSFILLKFQDERTCTEIVFIPGYNIDYVQVFEEEPTREMLRIIENILKEKEVHYSNQEIERRREALCVWFSGNRVPYSVTSSLDIEVLQAATIRPPYSTKSIYCKNEVVLDKVMKLVSNAPGLGTREG